MKLIDSIEDKSKTLLVYFFVIVLLFLSLARTLLSFSLCVDLTDPSSFERAKFWVNELKQTEEVSNERESTKVRELRDVHVHVLYLENYGKLE